MIELCHVVDVCPGYDAALAYENGNEFYHSAPCLVYYQALSAGMNLAGVQKVPRAMNAKGFAALCKFFRG